MLIPRKIHQIFLNGALPLQLAQHVASLQARNPGWEHRTYNNADAEDFIRTHYGQSMLDTYQRINPRYGAARADLLRHLLIYECGGVYLDIKSDAIKPLDEVILANDTYILTQWLNGPGEEYEGFGLHPELADIPGGEYQTYHIVGVSGHDFSRATIERIVKNVRSYKPWSGVGRMGTVRTTGPSAYTSAIHPLRAICQHRFTTEEELGFVPSISDYNHGEVFNIHYSQLRDPVCRLSWYGRLAQLAVEWARGAKGSVHRAAEETSTEN